MHLSLQLQLLVGLLYIVWVGPAPYVGWLNLFNMLKLVYFTAIGYAQAESLLMFFSGFFIWIFFRYLYLKGFRFLYLIFFRFLYLNVFNVSVSERFSGFCMWMFYRVSVSECFSGFSIWTLPEARNQPRYRVDRYTSQG